MAQRQVGSSGSLSRQQYGLLIAGGAAIGLAGFALWYIRRKNLALNSPPPPPAHIQMSALDPDGATSIPALPSSSTQSSSVSGEDAPANSGSQAFGTNGSYSSNGKHKSHDGTCKPQSVASEKQGKGLPPYGWAQNHEEAYLVTTCPSDVRSKEVNCQISPCSLQLSVRGQQVAAGKLFAPVDTSESTWELESMADMKKLTVTLVKAHGCSGHAEWPTLLEGNSMPALNTVMV